MFSKFVIFLTFLWFFLSGITWVAGETGKGLAGRVIAADLIGVIIIALYLLVTLLKQGGKVSVTKTHIAFFFVILGFFLSGVFANSPQKAFFELIILIFVFLISISLYNLWSLFRIELEDILKCLLWSGAILSFIGLLQFAVFNALFSGSHGGLSGTFRNTGQAGAYFATFLAILLPGFLAYRLKASAINLLMLASIFFALFFTFKRAALIGVVMGFLFVLFKLVFSVNKREKLIALKLFILTFGLGFLATIFLVWGMDNIDGLSWRFEKKLNADTVDDFQNGFLNQNIQHTLKAFEINPVIGVGLGNVAGFISKKYEIHSTYMAILATGGVLSCFLYLTFMGTWLKTIFTTSNINCHRAFLIMVGLMILGLIVSWGYTYHLRKREFWMLLTISLYVHYQFNNRQTK